MKAEEKERIIVVKETDVCTIKVDLSLSLLTVYWKQHMEGHEVRQNLMDMLVIVDTYKLRYLLGNVRALHYLKLEDAHWLWNSILPYLRASTIQKWARVEAPTSMVELNSLQIKKSLEAEGVEANELQFESFMDEESALHWLLDSDA